MTSSEDFSAGISLLSGVSWDFYQCKLRQLEGSPGTRLTFDNGRLEFFSTTCWHEYAKVTIARLIEWYALECDIRLTGLGSSTCLSRIVNKGFDPDESYYIQTPPPRPDNQFLDVSLEAPPDLIVEIFEPSRQISLQSVCDALRVPEMWKFEGDRIAPLHRRSNHGYESAEYSLSFPSLPMEKLNEFLKLALDKSQNDGLMELRDWVRSGQP